MRESPLAPLYFGETFKFCPNCGNSVVRFSDLPTFKEEFNRAIFEELIKIDNEYADKLDYYCRVILTQEEFIEIRKKCIFAVRLKENGDIAALSPAITRVAKMDAKPWNHWNMKKLKERMLRNE